MKCEDCGVKYICCSQFDDHECEPTIRCQESGCSHLSYLSSFCPYHQKYCEAKDCKKIVVVSEKYCAQHPKLCARNNCEYGVGYNETYCFSCSQAMRYQYYSSLPDSYLCASYPSCHN